MGGAWSLKYGTFWEGFSIFFPHNSWLLWDFLFFQIEVLDRDRNYNSGVYQSCLNPQLPPLYSTHARTVDYGNSVPELLRSSLYMAPCTANLLKESGVPFVLHMQPMAEYVT